VYRAETAWFLFNPTRDEIEETVDIRGYGSASDLLQAALPIENGTVRVKVGPADITCLVLEQA
jgi:hypothetical protein